MVIDYFKKEKKPLKGLLAVEWVVMIYLVVTLAATLIWYDTMTNPHALISGRIEVLFTTLLLWGVYRMYPSKAMRFIRIGVQMALLSWWYPDTYELNRQLPNLDHIFAGWEQSVFGCQPALLFSQHITSPVFSELMDLGYASYYPLIAIVSLYYLFRRNNEFERCVFIIMASFFTYYVIFDLVPVVGPTFYYKAVGTPYCGIPEFTCWCHHRTYVACMAHQEPSTGIYHAALLHTYVLRNSVHTGTLCYRRYRRTHQRYTFLLLLLLPFQIY